MLGAGLHFDRGEDRSYNPVNARRNHRQQRSLNGSSGSAEVAAKGKRVILDNQEPESGLVGSNKLSDPPLAKDSRSNLDRFLESTTPSIPAQYLSKTSLRGRRTCDVEFQPYFTLGDLWESFEEWSVYGAGVPLVLNDRDCVVQYYVPYLSGIQIYGESGRKSMFRQPGEDSDSDNCRDSSSDGSSDCEPERCSKHSWDPSNSISASDAVLRMDRLGLRETCIATLQEGSSSDEGEAGNSQGCLIYEFLEQDLPYSREPLADKIADLSRHFPELYTLRSCDLLPTSWISVAWYPIYRIPTGQTLRDLDACFLTFHHLSSLCNGSSFAQRPVVTHPDDLPKIPLSVFGLASYKFKSSMWTLNGGSEHQLANLLQSADSWLRALRVDHPDYQFFASRGCFRR